MAAQPPGNDRLATLGVVGSDALKWFLGLVLTFLAIGTVVTSVLIVQRQTALQRVSRYNLTWLLSQATTETMRLMETASSAAVPGSRVDGDDVQLRLDVLANRMNLLDQGEAREFIETREDLTATAAALRKAIAAAQPLVDALPSPQAANKIRDLFEPLVPRIQQMAALANTRSGDIVAEDQRDLSRLHWSLAGLLFAIMTCAAALVWLIAWMRGRVVRELTRARDAAEAASLAKSQFLANMSHELRTPLNGVLGAIELLTVSNLNPDQRAYAAIARQSGVVLLDLITTVLDFSRIEAGRLELEAEPFEPRALIQQVVGMLEGLAHAKQLTMATSLPANLPERCVGDATRLRQILINLIGNAIKFTQSGRITLSVSVSDAGALPLIRFEVRDTGIGVPAGKLDQIFEPFVQADQSNTRRHGGAGLGLTIARELVQLMDGQIGVDSEEGKGSVFWFEVRLPVVAAVPATDAFDPPIEPMHGEAKPTGLLAKILLVEDVATNARIGKLLLEQAGCEVDIAENGVIAVERCEQEAYDIILMDSHMPEMDGCEATRCIRESPSGRNVATMIVGLSADARNTERERCLASGMDDYLTKPITGSQLTRVIDDWRRRRAALVEAGLAPTGS